MKDSVTQGNVTHDYTGVVNADAIAVVTHAQRFAAQGEKQIAVDQT